MPQVIIPRLIDKPSLENGDTKELQIYHENQVECISISTSSENEESEEENEEIVYDGAIVASNQSNAPNFGSVNVVNSNDVHFGNKTVYKGPVTIKQFVYPKSDKDSDIVSGLSGLNGCVVDHKVSSSEGVENKGFVKEDNYTGGEDKPQEREQETNIVAGPVRKCVQWVITLPSRRPKETILFLFVLVVSVTTISALLIWRNPTEVIEVNQNDGSDNEEEDNNQPIDYTSDAIAGLPNNNVRMVTRIQWLAQPPSGPINNLTLPVSVVVIQHTATVSCESQAACIFQTRHIQTFHMESNSWNDIGYNFLIGGDGAVYEGRGWAKEGAHTLGVNSISIGIAFIGTYNTEIPPNKMLNAFHNLIQKGVKGQHLAKDYQVFGARQFSGTKSPGEAFYAVIKSWSHWSEKIS